MRAEIEFNATITDMLAEWLGHAGLTLLGVALSGQQPQPDHIRQNPTQVHRSQWPQWLHDATWQDPAPLPAGDGTAAYKATVRNAIYSAPTALVTPRRSIRDMLLRRSHAMPSGDNWTQQVVNEINRRSHVDSRFRLPESIWGLVIQRAWNDPRIMYAASRDIEQILRQRVLFRCGELKTFCLAPYTFALLLAKACAQIHYDLSFKSQPSGCLPTIRRARGDDPFKEIKAQQRFFLYLKEVAENQVVDQTGWASVWDQWVLLATGHWLQARLADQIQTQLDQIPLAAYNPHSDAHHFPASPQDSFAKADWASSDAIPTWFASIYR